MKLNEDDLEWDLIVKSENEKFSFNLKLYYKYRDLLYLFVKRDIVSFYKQTVLGPIWYFLQPIFTTIVYTVIFGYISKISTDGIPGPLFYLVGITCWNYFSDTLLKVSTVFRDNSNLFSKVYFPRLILPLSIIFSNLIRFVIQFSLILILIGYYGYIGFDFPFNFYLTVIPFLVLLLAFFALGLGMIFAALTTKYRDLIFLLNFGIQLLMYGTTVVYPLSSLTGNLKIMVSLNPLTHIIEGVRFCLLGRGDMYLDAILYIVFFILIIFLLGLYTFSKVEKSFVDTV